MAIKGGKTLTYLHGQQMDLLKVYRVCDCYRLNKSIRDAMDKMKRVQDTM